MGKANMCGTTADAASRLGLIQVFYRAISLIPKGPLLAEAV